MRTLFGVMLGALLAGCGAAGSIVVPGVWVGVGPTALVSHGESWMVPGAGRQALLYVDDADGSTVNVYTYRKRSLVGVLDTGASAGECIDSSQNVYITVRGGVVAYAHGGTEPIRKFTDAYGDPYACSVSGGASAHGNGDVAVANFSGADALYPGNVVIYGKHTIDTYDTKSIWHYTACGYDPNGDLFVGGQASSNSTEGAAFAMLPAGGGKLVDISLGASSKSWPYVGAIQWDGEYWAVTIPEQYDEHVYRFSIANGKAVAEGQTTLYVASEGNGVAWIVNLNSKRHAEGTQIVTAEGDGGEVQYFKYPGGLKAIGSITDTGYAAGVALSLSPK